jgi:hypothetical protein
MGVRRILHTLTVGLLFAIGFFIFVAYQSLDHFGGNYFAQVGGSSFSYPVDIFETYPKGQSATARTNEVVSFGFPFKKGELQNVQTLRVTGVTEAQFRETAEWPDGSVKWALVDFILPSLTTNSIVTSHAIASGGTGNIGGADICSVGSGIITANTGTGGVRAVVRQNGFNVFDSVTLNDAGNTELVTTGNQGGVTFIDGNNVEHSSRTNNATRFQVLENGPVRCQVVAEGMIGTANVGYRVIYDFLKGNRE